MPTPPVRIHVDGAARGNPGPAAYAYVIEPEGKKPIKYSEPIGEATNNVAEYTALIEALERASKEGLNGEPLLIHSDSELMVKQMNGVYRVKNQDLQELFNEAKQLARQFPVVTLVHVRREQNAEADRLCNVALDGQSPRKAPAASKGAKANPVRQDAAREEAIACLQQAAAAWARGQERQAPVEAVWDQLMSILQEHDLLR